MPGFAALSAGGDLTLAVPLLVLLAAILIMSAARRRDTDYAIGALSRDTIRQDRSRHRPEAPAPRRGREVERAAIAERSTARHPVPVTPAPPEPWVPPDPATLEVTRRGFLNRSIVGTATFGLGAFTLSTLGFLWPSGSGGFGSKIRVGSLSDIEAKITAGQGFAYYPEGRMWITAYPADALDKARVTYDPAIVAGMERGIVALYQKCPHLGCRVPQCVTSQWFECPCHGSQYNQVGEKKGGPAPRGMDRFPVEFASDSVTVDTGVIIQGPPIGTNTTGQEAEGPHCISAAGE